MWEVHVSAGAHGGQKMHRMQKIAVNCKSLMRVMRRKLGSPA